MTLIETVPKGRRIIASPLARRLAREGGIELGRLRGSGPNGRIVRSDLFAVPAPEPDIPVSAPATATIAAATDAGLVMAQFAPGSFVEIPLDAMRRTIARRLVASKQTVPHFYLTTECRLAALGAIRTDINAAAPLDAVGAPRYRLSINDFIIKALAVALQRVSEANVVWAEDRILRFTRSDVAVAVAVPGGLYTPVLRHAETRTLTAISTEMKDLAARARTGRLKPEDYAGGATTVSNLGMFGVSSFQAIINPPQSSILAVGAAGRRIVENDGAPAFAEMMTVTLSCDHRVIDGAVGADLLAAFRRLIEAPMAMIV